MAVIGGRTIDLSEEQWESIKKIDGQTLLLAVPGSGKTTTLIARIGRMVYDFGIDPSSILVITYTNAAADDMKKRFAELFEPQTAERIKFSTINSHCSSIVYEYERRSGHKKPKDDFDTELIIRKLFPVVYGEDEFPEDNCIRELVQKITYIKNMQLSEEEIEPVKADDHDVLPMYQSYVGYMSEEKKMDFDDQIIFAYKILKGNLEGIGDLYADRFPYLLVDEAQDTSKIQHMVIDLLARKYGNLFMVGDEDQSIYGFRAAFPKALMDFAERYPQGDTRYLQTNYRSVRSVIEAAGSVIVNNRDRHSKEIMPARDETGAVIVRECRRSEQYEKIVSELTRDSVSGSETAILFRNNDSALPFISIFEKNGISYSSRREESTFFGGKVIRDAVDILNFAFDPTSKRIAWRIYYKFNLHIRKKTLYDALKILNYKDDQPVWSALIREVTNQEKKQEIRHLMKQFKMIREKNDAVQAIRIIRHRMNYVNEASDKLFILEHIAYPGETVREFLDRIGVMEKKISGRHYDPNAKIILSTIHNSKGLEYDNVILVDAVSGILPDEDNDTEEERRIFYVGMTRAKDGLTIYDYTDHETPFVKETGLTKKRKVSVAEQRKRRSTVREPIKIDIDFKEGDMVRHARFGLGTVRSIEGESLKIDFGDNGEKTFSLKVCVEKGLVEKA